MVSAILQVISRRANYLAVYNREFQHTSIGILYHKRSSQLFRLNAWRRQMRLQSRHMPTRHRFLFPNLTYPSLIPQDPVVFLLDGVLYAGWITSPPVVPCTQKFIHLELFGTLPSLSEILISQGELGLFSAHILMKLIPSTQTPWAAARRHCVEGKIKGGWSSAIIMRNHKLYAFKRRCWKFDDLIRSTFLAFPLSVVCRFVWMARNRADSDSSTKCSMIIDRAVSGMSSMDAPSAYIYSHNISLYSVIGSIIW